MSSWLLKWYRILAENSGIVKGFALGYALDKRGEMGKDGDMKNLTHSAEETRALGEAVARDTKPGSILALRGDLGAGKTTFVQGFLEALGAEKPYVSPTFVIMKEYDLAEASANGIRRIYHVDAYRMDDPEEIEKLGFEEWCVDPEGLILVEWPEKIAPLLPLTTKTISFAWLSDTDREIIVG